MKTITAILELWVQTSSDYTSTKRNAVLVVQEDTTIGQVLAWAKKQNSLQQGPLTIEISDD